QIKSGATDGYSAVQVTFGKRRPSRVNKAAAGHLAKAAVEAGHILREFRVPESELDNFKLGGKIGADIFKVGQIVDVSGVSQGKGPSPKAAPSKAAASAAQSARTTPAPAGKAAPAPAAKAAPATGAKGA